MDLSFLPLKVLFAIDSLNINNLYEIRLRLNYPIIVNYDNQIKYLKCTGLCEDKKLAIVCDDNLINEIINHVTENSIYAFNDKIKNGYITTKDGIRIGIAGECVFDKERIITIKNFSSLNIRIPHEINGCSNKIYNYLSDKLYNALIISPPGFGKTTILKDLVKRINENFSKPILIIDERGEFYQIRGENIDVINYSDKLYAFNYAIRSMSPYVVITDELINQNDWLCVKNACESGVKVIATCHSDNIDKVKNKPFFIKGVFERYFLLDSNDKPGVLNSVYDEDFNVI